MATSVMHPIPKRTKDAARPPMQRSRSIDSRPAKPRHGLSHGFQMDLKQAVQLEKQELKKRGLLPPPIETEPLPKMVAPEDEDENASYWLYSQQRLARRAASFTSGAYQPMPCSPPVPIPQHEAQRRYSAADMKQQSLSTSQCEARLWDELWNYKLSFESRESLNISVKENTRASDLASLLKNRSESSADTVNEDEDIEGADSPEEEHVHRYGDVFEMDL
ncbi:hypothetical protein F441_00329 [Phytophthora nicotianae CJ01A1]|uniref:Uncharacterized protein n=2 Tax=Phytophthora nicotianae TaxID=4792 RepID=W2JXD2_PHYNI|nr:hypothetical protein L915_00313 [Phytophthora nicotianae]ETL50452.1 hypothetical protein L916_00316 [Phytophthora nicotianae]ETP27128.1 hypothetical protein F441_00329 [Phytophthora nicotianae CJ01A1]